jgi:hypothetical protein
VFSVTEEFGEIRLGRLEGDGIRFDPSFRLGFEVVAKIGVVLIAHFFRCWFATVFGAGCVVIDTKFADMQLGTAGGANL